MPAIGRSSRMRRTTLTLALSILCSGCGGDSRSDDPFGGIEGADGALESASGQGSSPAAEDHGATGGGIKLDVGGGASAGEEGGVVSDCDCTNASPVAYIWVANSPENTVSKINTVTMVEEGRYRTHPLSGDPSRTSVTITGRAVAVANRNGGVVKIWANATDCTDANGDGIVTTSSGAGDVLPWGEDECLAWFTPLDYQSNRPVAWTCLGGEKVWTSGGNFDGPPTPGPIHVLLLDGATGAIEETIVVEDFAGLDLAGYGGAVDAAGNFFVIPNGSPASIAGVPKMVRVDAVSLDYDLIDIPDSITSYGITVDRDGNPWVSSFGSVGAARYNVATGTWDVVSGFRSQSGLMQSEDGRIWVGTGTQGGINGPIGVYAIDPATLSLSSLIPLSGGEIKGISVDPQNKVWAVNQTPGVAYRIDPGAMAVEESYAGLSGPYTYSDMTGYAVQNTTGCVPPPAG